MSFKLPSSPSAFFSRRFEKPYLLDLALEQNRTNWRAVLPLVASLALVLMGFGMFGQTSQMTTPLGTAFAVLAAFAFWLSAAPLVWYFARYGRFRYPFPAVARLAQFVVDNGLFEKSVKVTPGRDGKERRKPVILSSARFLVYEDQAEVRITAFKEANRFQDKVGKLDEPLSAMLALPLHEKVDNLTEVVYVFRRAQSQRIALADMAQGAQSWVIPLMSDLVWDVTKAPHALVCGGTGSGKTVLIDALIWAFLKRGASVFVADPKNSDLGQLSQVLGENVGTTPGTIARVVRRCLETMEERFVHMSAPGNFRYGADWRDHCFAPCVIFFDELAAFKAGCDKQTFAEVNAALTQIILKGRQAGCFVVLSVQQPRAEVLPTDLRDQLGLRVMLGNAAGPEILRMVFGSVDVSGLRTVSGPGEGHILVDGLGWNAPKPFSAPFCDFKEVDFLETVRGLVPPSGAVGESAAAGDALPEDEVTATA